MARSALAMAVEARVEGRRNTHTAGTRCGCGATEREPNNPGPGAADACLRRPLVPGRQAAHHGCRPARQSSRDLKLTTLAPANTHVQDPAANQALQRS